MTTTTKSWPLNDSNFTFLDRLKIAAFFLNKKNFWTMTNEVEKFEEQMRDYVGSKHAVFVSSGSTANTILAMYLKDKVYNKTKNTIVFPSTTWITSVSPFIREGFKPEFIDITLEDLSMDLKRLESYLIKNHQRVACVFITSLLGFVPSIQQLKKLEERYKVRIMLDNCESTLSQYDTKNISSYFTSTTSTYFGHQLQSVEGGFIFTNNDEEYEYFLLARNHGMVRGLKTNHEKYRNKDVDSRFDFNILGNNFRNTNINAFIGQLDFKRVEKYVNDRRDLYSYFEHAVEKTRGLIPINMRHGKVMDVPFCLPLIFKRKLVKECVIGYCNKNNIETRPIISGNLLRQTCLRDNFNPWAYKNSEFIHENGFYVGLHSKVTKDQLVKLLDHVTFIATY
jgi:CDP-6-deoxy-D-xylo-4-hexulose-3-dehydrase